MRDTVVRVTDPVGGGVGWGNWQPIASRDLPELGLDAPTSHGGDVPSSPVRPG